MSQPPLVPRWFDIDTVHLLHARQLELFGGLAGVRDGGAIESALARPVNPWSYGEAGDVESLAAAYRFHALARQQGYLDGNKRVALAATDELRVPQLAAWMEAHVSVTTPAGARGS